MYPNRTQPGNFVRPHFPPPPRPLNQSMPMYFQSDEPAQQPGYVGFFAGSQQHQMPQNNNHFPPSTSSSNQDYSANYFDYGNDDQTEQNYEDYDGNYDFELDATFGYNGRGRREEKLANKKGTHYCDICNCECVGAESFQSHLDGKSHKKKEKSAQGFLQTTLKNKPAYHCEICNIDCSGADTYQTHISGKKHQNAIRILIKANKPIPSTEVSLVLPETNETDEEGGGSKKKGKKRKAAANSSEEEYANPNLIPLNSGLFKPEIINEKHIQEKINQIELNEEQNAAVEKLVQLVEETLYNVSNLIESNRNQQSTGDGNEASARLLRGVMRVGLLANQFLMKSDRRADLVILCSAIPTSDLLYQIVELFRRNINETQKNQNLGYENSINITEMFNESAFIISRTGIPISIFVTLTCSAMRQWSPGDLNYHPYHEPPNALPKIPSLHALAEMRRTKFYQVKCEPHPAMNWTVKIVRDFGNRVPAWSHLSNWMIILIVEKALSLSLSKNPESPVGPSGALKALFSAISDGLILGQNTPLPDPCEKLATDAIASLGGNERTKIFQSARYSLRQMNTNNLAKLLALEGTGVPSMEYSRPTADMPKKKRPNPNNTPGMGNMQNGPNNSSRFETWRPGRMTNTY